MKFHKIHDFLRKGCNTAGFETGFYTGLHRIRHKPGPRLKQGDIKHGLWIKTRIGIGTREVVGGGLGGYRVCPPRAVLGSYRHYPGYHGPRAPPYSSGDTVYSRCHSGCPVFTRLLLVTTCGPSAPLVWDTTVEDTTVEDTPVNDTPVNDKTTKTDRKRATFSEKSTKLRILVVFWKLVIYTRNLVIYTRNLVIISRFCHNC